MPTRRSGAGPMMRHRRSALFIPVAANGHIYLISLNGKAAILTAGDKLNIVWKADFKETTAPTPAISGDTLFVLTATKLYAFTSAP